MRVSRSLSRKIADSAGCSSSSAGGGIRCDGPARATSAAAAAGASGSALIGHADDLRSRWTRGRSAPPYAAAVRRAAGAAALQCSAEGTRQLALVTGVTEDDRRGEPRKTRSPSRSAAKRPARCTIHRGLHDGDTAIGGRRRARSPTMGARARRRGVQGRECTVKEINAARRRARRRAEECRRSGSASSTCRGDPPVHDVRGCEKGRADDKGRARGLNTKTECRKNATATAPAATARRTAPESSAPPRCRAIAPPPPPRGGRSRRRARGARRRRWRRRSGASARRRARRRRRPTARCAGCAASHSSSSSSSCASCASSVCVPGKKRVGPSAGLTSCSATKAVKSSGSGSHSTSACTSCGAAPPADTSAASSHSSASGAAEVGKGVAERPAQQLAQRGAHRRRERQPQVPARLHVPGRTSAREHLRSTRYCHC